MPKNKTIEDVKKAKIQLEKDILGMVSDFEKENGIYINYINLERKSDDTMAEVPKRANRGPVVNVNANMELDLVY